MSDHVSERDAAQARNGVGFFSLLGILFIGLRLAGCIDWPWWVVLLPIWGPCVFWLLLVGGLVFALAVKKRFEE